METQTHFYRLSYAEWLAGVRFARKRNTVWMLRYLLSWLIPALLAYLLLALLWNAINGTAKWGDAENGGLVIALLLGGIVGYRVFRIRRAYTQSAFAKHPEGLAIAFNDEYFVSGLPGRSEGRFLWPAFYDFAEDDRTALIYTSKNRFIIVPKHAMPEDSWAIVRQMMPRRKGK